MRQSATQPSFDDLGTPLSDVRFCVLDLETTGSTSADAITEIGMVVVRGGEVERTFATLVNPGTRIPPSITVLTGISDAMVTRAPRIESVLGSTLDIIGDSVIVGHNVGFDLRFLQAALQRDNRPPLTNPSLDTLRLARRLVQDEVPNLKLDTLASHFRLTTRPTHRAFDDASATAELLMALIERAAGHGVYGLDDMLALPTLQGSAAVAKLGLTARLPRGGGIYLFRNARGEVLYVGKAKNLRARVRSYFTTDGRRKIPALLREAERIDHKKCATSLESEILEARLIKHCAPRYNRAGKNAPRSCYVRLTTDALARLVITYDPPRSGPTLGPLRSRAVATEIVDAIHSVYPLRRCTSTSSPCIPAQLGVALCPCMGAVDRSLYARIVESVKALFAGEVAECAASLEERMRSLARTQRFEDAAAVRDRRDHLLSAVHRQHRIDVLRDSDTMSVNLGSDWFRFERGQLIGHAVANSDALFELVYRPIEARPDPPARSWEGPIEPRHLDELLIVSRFLDRARPGWDLAQDLGSIAS